jgi:hypothetical protein
VAALAVAHSFGCHSAAERRNLLLPLPDSTHQSGNRHFDRSRSRFCERRSGEIRFSSPLLQAPKKSFQNTPKNTSKFACQAPEPLNPFPINNICMKESFTQSAIIELEGKKAESPAKKVRAFYFNSNK